MDDKLYAVLYLDESRMIIWSTYWNYSSFILTCSYFYIHKKVGLSDSNFRIKKVGLVFFFFLPFF